MVIRPDLSVIYPRRPSFDRRRVRCQAIVHELCRDIEFLNDSLVAFQDSLSAKIVQILGSFAQISGCDLNDPPEISETASLTAL